MRKQLSHDTRAAMDRLVGSLTTKSDKIRALAEAHYERADIARYLDIRYQHVRNVLVNDEKKREKGPSKESHDIPPDQIWTQIGAGGRLVVPAPYRQMLGIEDGGHVLLRLEDDEVRMIGRDTAIARIQDMVAKYVPEGVSLVDDLLAERRREVEREEREAGNPREARKRG